MTGREVLRRLARHGCVEIRRRGSHAIVRCGGGCQTVVPVHAREDLPVGTLRNISRALAPCLGEEWSR
jgi:predicted RNA binding protein YcfA (HicA-like mRNA interferase family)